MGGAHSSLTFHLQALLRAGLLRRRREGRQLIYSADFAAMNSLVGFLSDHCCVEAGGADARYVPRGVPVRAGRHV